LEKSDLSYFNNLLEKGIGYLKWMTALMFSTIIFGIGLALSIGFLQVIPAIIALVLFIGSIVTFWLISVRYDKISKEINQKIYKNNFKTK